MAPPARTPSLASGMAALAVIAALCVTGRGLWGIVRQAHGSGVPVTVCGTPVEIQKVGGSFLGCAEDADVASCGAMDAGDLLVVSPGVGCKRYPAGMRASWRLLCGLPLDLNTANAKDLALLRGIGGKTGEAIVAYRQARGAFAHVDELVFVKGIGKKTLERLRPFVQVVVPHGNDYRE